jgi:imidazolonepropionase-like amidohydrolase
MGAPVMTVVRMGARVAAFAPRFIATSVLVCGDQAGAFIMARIRQTITLWLICGTLLGSAATAAVPVDTTDANSGVAVFEHVSVVPMDSNRVLPDQSVLIQGDRITSIGPVETIRLPPQALRVDGRGKFLMPGLADMHVHLLGGDETAKMLSLFLAYGITTIRQMAGSPGVLALRRKVSEGEVLGPTIFTVGELIDGSPPVFGSGSAVATTPDMAREVVDRQKQAGYDEVKVYDNLLAPEYEAVMAEAARVGIPVVGHLPKDVPLERALELHQATIEHLTGYLTYLQRRDSPFVFAHRDTGPSAGTPMSAGHASNADLEMPKWIDPDRIPAIAKLTAEAGTWSVPTLVQLANAKRKEEYPKAWKRPGMQFATRTMREWWNSDVESSDPAARARLLDVRLSIVRALHQAGAKLLVGTDSPHPFVLPGLSAHDELHNLILAGLTPYEALWSATRGPAQFLGQPQEFGVVAAGGRADLVLLEANPLTNIDNASRIVGVMVRGRWLSRARLRQDLERLAYKQPRPN